MWSRGAYANDKAIKGPYALLLKYASDEILISMFLSQINIINYYKIFHPRSRIFLGGGVAENVLRPLCATLPLMKIFLPHLKKESAFMKKNPGHTSVWMLWLKLLFLPEADNLSCSTFLFTLIYNR